MITIANSIKFNNLSTQDYENVTVTENQIAFGNNKILEVKEDDRIFYNGERIYYNCNNCVECTTCNSNCHSCDSCTASCDGCDTCNDYCYNCDSCFSHCTNCTICYSCHSIIDPCEKEVEIECSVCNNCQKCAGVYDDCEFSCGNDFPGCLMCVGCYSKCTDNHDKINCTNGYYRYCRSCQNKCYNCVNICYGGTAKW